MVLKLKLDFDTRKNMSSFAYYYSKLKGLNKLHGIHLAQKLIRNWYDVIFFKAGIKKSIIIKLRNGNNVNIDNIEAYNRFWEGEELLVERISEIKSKGYDINLNEKEHIIEIKKFGRNIKFYDVNRAINTIGLIKENFVDEHYRNLDIKDKDVVDVGANIGDTAIYFALKGAKHVYAFEPYPYSYNIAMKNIKLNCLEDRITLLNEGCGISGFVTIKEEYKSTGRTDLKKFKEGNKIRVESLDEIVKRFNLKHSALKVDCEGCEYDLILNASDEALKAFDQIIMEYHYGYRNLVKRLRQTRFKVKYSLPKYFHNIEAEDSNTYLGLIFATRIG